MLNFVPKNAPYQESPESQAIRDSAIVPPLGSYLQAEASTGTLGALARRRERETVTGPLDEYGLARTTPVPVLPTKPPEELNKQFPLPEGLPALFDAPMREDLASTIYQQKLEEIKRDSIIARYSAGHGLPNRFFWGSVGFMMDPTQAATALVPGFGEEAVLARLGVRVGARVAGLAGKAAVGVTGGALSQGLVSGARLLMADDSGVDEYTLRQAASDVFLAATLNAAFHTTFASHGGAISQLRGYVPTLYRALTPNDVTAAESAIARSLGLADNTQQAEVDRAVQEALHTAVSVANNESIRARASGQTAVEVALKDATERENAVFQSVTRGLSEALGIASGRPMTSEEIGRIANALNEVREAPKPAGVRAPEDAITSARADTESALSPADLRKLDDGYAFAGTGTSTDEIKTRALRPLPEGMVVYRTGGIVSDTMFEPGHFISTATRREVPEGMASTMSKVEPGRTHEIAEIRVAPGTRGFVPRSGLEHEVVLGPDTVFTPVGAPRSETLANGLQVKVQRYVARSPEDGSLAVERSISDAQEAAVAQPPDTLHAQLATAIAQAIDDRPIQVPTGSAGGEVITRFNKQFAIDNFGKRRPDGTPEIDGAAFSNAVETQVRTALAVGKQVFMHVEGKDRRVFSVSRLGLVDKNGNPWGVQAFLFTTPGERMDIEIREPPRTPDLVQVAQDQANLYREGYALGRPQTATVAAKDLVFNREEPNEAHQPASSKANAESETREVLGVEHFKPVVSSNIAAWAHKGTELQVQFKNGTIYSYTGVPESVASAFAASESKGKFLAQKIKGTYEFQKLAADTDPEMQLAEAALGGEVTPEVIEADTAYRAAQQATEGFTQAAQCLMKAGV